MGCNQDASDWKPPGFSGEALGGACCSGCSGDGGHGGRGGAYKLIARSSISGTQDVTRATSSRADLSVDHLGQDQHLSVGVDGGGAPLTGGTVEGEPVYRVTHLVPGKGGQRRKLTFELTGLEVDKENPCDVKIKVSFCIPETAAGIFGHSLTAEDARNVASLVGKIKKGIEDRLNGFKGSCSCPPGKEGGCSLSIKAEVILYKDGLRGHALATKNKCRPIMMESGRSGGVAPRDGLPILLPGVDPVAWSDPRPNSDESGPIGERHVPIVQFALHEAGHAIGHTAVEGSATLDGVDRNGHGLPIGEDGSTAEDEPGRQEFWESGRSSAFGGRLMSPGYESVLPARDKPLFGEKEVCQILAGLKTCPPKKCCRASTGGTTPRGGGTTPRGGGTTPRGGGRRDPVYGNPPGTTPSLERTGAKATMQSYAYSSSRTHRSEAGCECASCHAHPHSATPSVQVMPLAPKGGSGIGRPGDIHDEYYNIIGAAGAIRSHGV